jgi:hypothetical protein
VYVCVCVCVCVRVCVYAHTSARTHTQCSSVSMRRAHSHKDCVCIHYVCVFVCVYIYIYIYIYIYVYIVIIIIIIIICVGARGQAGEIADLLTNAEAGERVLPKDFAQKYGTHACKNLCTYVGMYVCMLYSEEFAQMYGMHAYMYEYFCVCMCKVEVCSEETLLRNTVCKYACMYVLIISLVHVCMNASMPCNGFAQ